MFVDPALHVDTHRSWIVTVSPSMPTTSVTLVTRRTRPGEADVDDDVDCGRDLLTQRSHGEIHAGHQPQRLEAKKDIAWRVRVDRADRSIVARVHRL